MTTNTLAAYMDLASYSEIENDLYIGSNMNNKFTPSHIEKMQWIALTPMSLPTSNGTPEFGKIFRCLLHRDGDYMYKMWIIVELPKINKGYWVPNLLHNLIEKVDLFYYDSYGEKHIVASLNSYALDAITAFTKPSDDSHWKNIGNNITPSAGQTLMMDIPFYFTKYLCKSLPMTVVVYNTLEVEFTFRNWTELLMIDDRYAQPSDFEEIPVLGKVELYAKYIIVTGEARKEMVLHPHRMIIEQCQTIVKNLDSENKAYLTFKGPVKAFFFMVRHKSKCSEYIPLTEKIKLFYKNITRLDMPPSYFSIIEPYHQPNAVVPIEEGYYMHSYASDFKSMEPSGSTNYTSFNNEISLSLGQVFSNEYELIVVALTHNIITFRDGLITLKYEYPSNIIIV